MLRAEELRDGPYLDDLAVGERGDAIGDRIQAIEIVGDHKNSEAQRLLSVLISTSKSLAEIGSSP